MLSRQQQVGAGSARARFIQQVMDEHSDVVAEIVRLLSSESGTAGKEP
jgi:hypothetical protein